MSLFVYNKSDMVNVKMVITEEKILSNIDKIQKLINPNSKKQIVKLDEDTYFKDLVESVKNYLLEYPKKNNFPKSVYKASYDLVEYATNQFEENTKKVEELIRKRERNIKLANVLRDASAALTGKVKNSNEILKKLGSKYPAEVVDNLEIIANAEDTESEEYLNACREIDAKVNNLEGNLYIEIDMDRLEDRSKALSYIGIEIAEALKYIPVPVDDMEDVSSEEKINTTYDAVQNEIVEDAEDTVDADFSDDNSIEDVAEEESYDAVDADEDIAEEKSLLDETTESAEKTAEDFAADIEDVAEDRNYIEETRFETKPSLWQKIKNSKFVRTLRCVMQIRITIDYPALPEGRGENLENN